MGGKANLEPIVSKIYCSKSKTVLTVRRRPHVVNGGGFVVTSSSQKVLFRVEGCGTLGTKKELVLRDGAGDLLLLIRQKQGGIIEALSLYKQWRGYMRNYEAAEKLVFSLKEPKSCLVKNVTTITAQPRRCNNKDWDFQIKGSFPDKACSIIDSKGNTVAQVGVLLEEEEVASNKDVYHVVVQPGFDQAFVVGVIAVLDNINDESTRC